MGQGRLAVRRERGVLGEEEFTGLVKESRLADLARDLIAAMDAASPDDASEPGNEDHTPQAHDRSADFSYPHHPPGQLPAGAGERAFLAHHQGLSSA